MRPGHDGFAHRHGAHRRSLRRQPGRARRARGRPDAERCRAHDAQAAGRRRFHRRGGCALPPGHGGVARLRRRDAAGGAVRHARHRRQGVQGRAGAYRLPRRCAGAAVPAARVRRASHRAGPGARPRGHHHRRRRGPAGHFVDRGADHRSVESRGDDADADAARRRLLRGRDRNVRAPAGAGTRRQPGRHRRVDHPASEPDQRHRGARARDRGSAQHRRRGADPVGAAGWRRSCSNSSATKA